MADVEHGERLINTDDPAALEALRHRPSHSTGTRRHVENLFVALQNEHFSQFLGEIGADLRGAAIELRRVLRIMEMSLVPVLTFVTVFMSMFMTVLVVVSMFVIMSVVMFVAVLVLVIMLVAVLVMLMFVSVFVIVLMFVFVFFAHCFTIPSQI